MRMWMKSACVVLALGVPLILLVVGLYGSDSQAQAHTRIASRTLATLTAAVSPAVPVVTAGKPATYVVQHGDTLSGIAARFAIPGGWAALYAANQALLGPDPNAIQPGTVLVLPGKTAPVRYTVRPGDTLSGIAAAFAVPGGWTALYAANRHAIGANPSVIQPGTVLMVPHRVAPATIPGTPHRRALQPATNSRPPVPHPARSPTPTSTRRAHVLVRTKLPAAGMPRWLVTMLLGVALLIGAAFLAEPVVVLAGRRRRTARPHQSTVGNPLRGPGHGRRVVKPRIVMADYDRLVVIQCKNDDTVYVLRPPGEDPVAVLRAARLVLRERSYRQLAEHLGAPTRTQTGDSRGSEPSRRPVFPDGSGGPGRHGSPQFFGLRNPPEDWDQDLLRRDSTKAAT